MRRKRKPKVIHVHGRRWFQKSYGNTYHIYSISIDGEHVFKSERTYGYDSQYSWNAFQWLKENKYLNPPEDLQYACMSIVCREMGIILIDTVQDVPRQRDL